MTATRTRLRLRALLGQQHSDTQSTKTTSISTLDTSTALTSRSSSDESHEIQSPSGSSMTTHSDPRADAGGILLPRASSAPAQRMSRPRLCSSIVRAADRAAHFVLEEALRTEPSRPSRHPRLIDGPSKMDLFELVYDRACKENGAHQDRPSRRWRLEQSGDDPESPVMPRVFGRMQLRASLQEFLSAVVQRDNLAESDHRVDQLVNPGAEDTALCFVATDNYSEYTAIKRFKRRLPSSVWHRRPLQRRDFVVMTHQREFTADDGRRGWLVVHHSAKWPVGGDHQDKSLPAPATTSSTPERSERPGGSIYHSGLVVLESFDDPMELDVFAVGEFRLRGSATGRDNHNAARAFVRELLENVSTEVERRAAARLSLLQSQVFHAVRADSGSEHARCVACRDRIGHCPPNTAPYVCRKCCENVCGCCSSVNRLGTKELRFCMECWADAALNRDLA